MRDKINKSRIRRNWFKLMFILIAIHSFVIASGLIFCPVRFLSFFDFKIPDVKFFVTQSGIFHYIISFGYIMIAFWPERNQGLIVLSIITKLMATVFLFSYYFLVDNGWAILLCGIIDCIIGLTILWCYFVLYWDLDKIKFDLTDFKYNI